MNTKLAFVLAIVLGVIAAIGMKSIVKKDKEARAAAVEPVAILAADKKIRKGAVLSGQDCKRNYLPKKYVIRGMIPFNERRRFYGKVVNVDLSAGSTIFESQLESSNAESSSARTAVKEGMRAVTLHVDQVSGVAGLIKPGDYVDVAGTFDVNELVTNSDSPQGRAVTRKTKTVYLLQAIKVLALDNRISGAVTGKVRRGIPYRTVTLQVLPEDALRLINAKNQGRVQLILRNPTEAEIVRGVSEVKSGKNTLRMQPTLNWDIRNEVNRTENIEDIK